jgi:hypothetical protein
LPRPFEATLDRAASDVRQAVAIPPDSLRSALISILGRQIFGPRFAPERADPRCVLCKRYAGGRLFSGHAEK